MGLPARSDSTRKVAVLWLPPVALAVFVMGVAIILAAAGDTRGWDYVSYHDAAVRFLNGVPAAAYPAAFWVGIGLLLVQGWTSPAQRHHGLPRSAPGGWRGRRQRVTGA